MRFRASARQQPAERSTDEFSRLTHLIYEAGVQPERWPDAVEALAASVGADKGLLFTPYLAPQDGGLLFPWNFKEADLQLWATHYIEHDIWAAAGLERGLWQDGAVLPDEEIVPRDVLVQSMYFREYLCRVGIGHLCACAVLAGAPGLPATALSLYRPLEGRPFDREEQAWLRLLVPHLSRALGVMHRLGTARLRAASFRSALDRLAFGVALLDERHQIVHLNEAAAAAIARGDGLTVNSQRQLDTQGGGGRAGLLQWMDSRRSPRMPGPAHFCESFTVPRSGAGGRTYALQYSPLPASGSWPGHDESARFVVFITDPDAVVLPDGERLRTLYGFTEAQARVARALAGGGTYRSTAAQLGVSEDTVRSHVKEIYAKARVNRLSDLVRAILSQAQATL